VDVSIIIPTLNRASRLRSVLYSVARQSEASVESEVLLVDNGSTDGTRALYERVVSESPSMRWRYIHEPLPGVLSARHRGALESDGHVLVYLDDDVEVADGWLEAISDAFEGDPSVQIVGGPSLPTYEVEPPYWLREFWVEDEPGVYCDWLSLIDLGERRRTVDANLIWSLNMAIRRDALFELGGFHPDFFPDDLKHYQGDAETGLTRNANARGYKAIYEPRAGVTHLITARRFTPEYLERRGLYRGIGASFAESRSRLRGEQPAPRLRAGRIASHLKTLRLRLKKHRSSADAKRALIAAEQSTLAGYRFHQASLRFYEGLADWVARDDYWDYRLPRLRKREPRRARASRKSPAGR
jgi:glucosyl-dolichyl phosphate glucuronosyltransferase